MTNKVVMPLEDYKNACDAVRKTTKTNGLIKSGELAEKISGLTGADVSFVTATADDVLSGKKFVDSSKQIVTGTMPNNSTVNSVISKKTDKITIKKGYHDGTGTISISSSEQAKIIPKNIKSGVSFLGVNGVRGPYHMAGGNYNAGTESFSVTLPIQSSWDIRGIIFVTGTVKNDAMSYIYYYKEESGFEFGAFGYSDNTRNFEMNINISRASSSINMMWNGGYGVWGNCYYNIIYK